MDRPWALPFGGGPFKGFAFVIVENEEEASRILKEWPWDKQKNSEDSGMEVDEGSEADKLQIEREKAARTIGFRALS
jgi:prophage DNA circulation protein